MNLNRHPILMQAYNVIQAIEKCGASPELTAAVVAAGDLRTAIEALVLDTERLEFVLPVISGVATPETDMRTFAIGLAIAHELQGRDALDKAMKLHAEKKEVSPHENPTKAN